MIKWLCIFGAWMLVAMIYTSHFYMQDQLTRNPFPLWKAIFLQFFGACGWFAMTPLILWVGRRFPIKWNGISKNLSVQMVFGVLIVLLFVAYLTLVLPKFGLPSSNAPNQPFGEIYRIILLSNFHHNYLNFWVVIGIQNSIAFYHEYRERELRAARLEGQLADARLQALKNQLHPHFFFNTMNAISALMYRSPKEASRMITQLGDLIRVSLKKDKADEITLKEELEFLEAYLQIHQTLMGKRLQIEWRIEPNTLDALVPNLILQPLAENAIQHGLAPLEEGGQITICAVRENKELHLQVSDTGCGFATKNQFHHNAGIGITNTRGRLENLYNGKHQFLVEELTTGGVTVKIDIPFREQKAEKNEYQNNYR